MKMFGETKKTVKKNKARGIRHEAQAALYAPRITAFTLVELVVAVGLLSMAIMFSAMIFKVSVETRRTAQANEEIMQNFRAITDQLNSDFKGLDRTTPLLIQFRQFSDDRRFDQIMFFSTGDFTSNQLYDVDTTLPGPDNYIPQNTGVLIRGNAARIYYGQANIIDSSGAIINGYGTNGLLSRRQHILTANPQLYPWPLSGLSGFNLFAFYSPLSDNEYFEHDSLSLAQWRVVNQALYDPVIIPTCFGSGVTATGRTQIDLNNPNTLHNLMCQGVGIFAIQWAYQDATGQYLWFPNDTPYGIGRYPHYAEMTLIDDLLPYFGVRFGVTGDTHTAGTGWFPIGQVLSDPLNSVYFPGNFYPNAIKFTITLYDSRGVVKNGRTFTHIVYIGD